MTTMDNFISTINASANISESVQQTIISNFKQYEDAMRPYNGKTKRAVLDQSSNKREHLADSMFSLRDVCSSLFLILRDMASNPENEVVQKFSSLFQSSFKKLSEELVSNVEKSMLTACTAATTTSSTEPSEKHVILLENKDIEGEESASFESGAWNEVCKKSLKKSLKNVPVLKTKLSKEGKDAFSCLIKRHCNKPKLHWRTILKSPLALL